MYKIDANAANTSDIGIGKGAAQIIDLKPMRDQNRFDAEVKYKQDLAKQKIQDDRDADLQAQMAQMSNVKIMPRDQELIAQKGQGVRDYVVKNIDSLRKGDAKAMMGFQQVYGDYKTTADLSQNTREDWERVGTEIMKDPEAYTEESMDAYWKHASKESAGNFAFDKSQLVKNINYGKHVMKDLSVYAERQAKKDGRVTAYTLPEAEQLITDDLTDKKNMGQAFRDFKKASKAELDFLGNPDNPVDYYKKKWAPKLIEHNVSPSPQNRSSNSGGGGGTKQPNVAGTFVRTEDGKGDFQFEYTNTTDNPFIMISDPKDPKGQLNVKPISIHVDSKNPKNTTMKAAVQLTEAQKSSGEKEEVVTLDYTNTNNIMNNKFGIDNVFSIEKGNTPDHVKVSYSDISDKKDKAAPIEKKQDSEWKILQGKINPSTLIKDGKYTTGGKNYIWNGTKLVEQ